MIINHHYKYLLAVWSILLWTLGAVAQTEVTTPMTGTPSAGEYYSTSSITLSPNFSFTATAGNSFHAYIQSIDCQPLNLSLSVNQNYILTSVPLIGGFTSNGSGVNTGSFANRSTCELMQSVTYFDGLGRPLQSIQIKGSPDGRDIVQPVAYDPYGREAIKYLPYAAVSSSSNGSYKGTAMADQSSFYISPSGSTWKAPGVVVIPAVGGTSPTFAQTVFEPSPLNRIIEQGAQGADWQPAAGHTVKQVYTINNINALTDTGNTRLAAMYIATANANGSRSLTRAAGAAGNYPAGQLYVTISKDENWKSGRGGTTEEYKDKEGHVVLKRTFNYTGTTLQILSTYYVYDELGNLAYVLPPGTNPDGTGVPTTVSSLGYSYRYDERNRLTQKKIPGKGWEFTVYNKLDQPVLTQDSTQRTANQWTTTKYDALGRVIITGLWNAGSVIPLTTLQGSIYGGSQWDIRNTADNTTGYTITSYPALSKTLTVNYYDDYSGIPNIPGDFVVTGNSTMTRGLLTATRTAVLNTITSATPDYLWTAHYYDDQGRNTVSYQQHDLGGTVSPYNYDVVNTSYNFTNKPDSVRRQHYTKTTAGTAKQLAVTVDNQYRYDHMGRKLSTWEQLTNPGQPAGTRTLISQAEYNEIGQLYKKHLHSTDSVTFRQDITYAYNERGWLLKSTSPLFSEQLYYNTGTNKQYNGNIAYQFWGAGSTLDKNYTYGYDQLNRLTSGNSTLGNNENSITYDNMGNITALKRYGTSSLIDQLSYTYATNSVKLASVNDATTSDAGQKQGTTSYTYDGNGNLKSDNSKGITSITYNLLNLPQVITGKSTTYTYDATGQKLSRVIGTDRTDYIGGIQYENGTISFIQTEEGRALPNGGTNYNYEYTLADHLGNSRVNFDTATGTARLVQTDDYYPFGMDIKSGTIPSVKNNYLYNRKELQENLGLYDYGARFYDPVIARWTTVDPLAEKGRRWSPYAYVFNNPMRFIDPDGMWGDIYNLNGTHVGNDGVKDDKVYVQKNKDDTQLTKEQSLAAEKSGAVQKLDIGEKELEHFAANVYNETPGLGKTESDKVASAMVNRAKSHKQSIMVMLNNVMFNGDSEEKKMSETWRNTDSKGKYPGHKFPIRNVATNNYREFMNTSVDGRNSVSAFKTAVRSTVIQFTFGVDLVNGADSWRGDGQHNHYSTGN
ncbi:DUF6443 domain-containing protein [Mucilaginibacter sabulilitoris]|uniref:DUF6443 domain-containing protein n=1 Tax=Mucilaginibacter sabulilitoris TaxID=1173583 RepID=A0ABZ0TRU7_9SPHI|nr:DUF6443 domain-containing protein [Mucilaginibacter sabulilitoris]WPU95634.1 DUF6443 domain-containing protein [Mucilaginibacter sabulilitoris]